MFAYASRFHLLFLAAAAIAVALFVDVTAVTAQVLYTEDFEDATLAENTMVVNSTIANGFGSFDDPAPARATFSVVQDLTAEILTFSFDVVAPIVRAEPASMEVILRAGVDTAHNTLQNADQVVEAILFRDGNRGAYTNNGNETIFLVANNKASDLVFTSPIDGSSVTLTGFQYIPYVKNNDTDIFGQIKGISNFNGGQRPLNRFAIGSSSTAHVGTFAIDNVLVKSEVSFDTMVGPPPVLGDVDGDGVGGEFPDDFEPIRANFRKTVSSRAQGDLIRDSIVDFADFKQWKTVFLGGGSLEGLDLSFTAAVPEPTSAWLLLMAGCGLVCRVRMRAGS